jgi:hypothetical protein
LSLVVFSTPLPFRFILSHKSSSLSKECRPRELAAQETLG